MIEKNNSEEFFYFIDEFKNILNSSNIKRSFRLGNELIDALQPFIEKPTYWNASKAIFSIGRILVDSEELWPEEYFDNSSWVEPYRYNFSNIIMHVISKYPFVSLKTAVEGTYIRFFDVENIKIGTIYNSKESCVDNIYVESKNLDNAKLIIKKLLWQHFKNKPLVLKQDKSFESMIKSGNSDNSKVVLEIDEVFDSLPSEKATEYSTYLKKCFNAGVSRSVMLYGPPGTGKSTMARALVNNLNLRSFRIRIEDISNLNNSTLFEAINIFEPQAVILDDFDRADSQASLLETLEFFQRHVKLVVATVNNKNNLDEALLRPGRFDELIFVDKMDESVVKLILGEFKDGYEDVKDWPVAFIQEYVKRRKFMSPNDVKKSMEELAKRIKRLEQYQDDEDITWHSILEKKVVDKKTNKKA